MALEEENRVEEPENEPEIENKAVNKQNNLYKEVLSWVKIVFVAFILAFLINNVLIVNAKVPTGSMNNTIMDNDRVIGFRLSYLFSDPQRGDIVIFKFPDDETQNYVKRIIGLPGETVEIREGKVYIDYALKPLEEDYLKETPDASDFGPYKVPEGHYFMLGDNRNISNDARYWTNKYVARNKIVGKVIFRYYPSFKLFNQ